MAEELVEEQVGGGEEEGGFEEVGTWPKDEEKNVGPGRGIKPTAGRVSRKEEKRRRGG